jgi:ribosomal protein L24E
VLLAWEDAWGDGPGKNNPNKVWYTKEVWYDEQGNPNYRNAAGNEFHYWANDYIGSDGYARANDEVFILPTKVGHFQMKGVGWDSDNPVKGADSWGDPIDSPIFQIRFRFGRNQYIYVGNNGFEEDPDDAENYTVQLFIEWDKKNQPEYYYGSVNIFVNMGGDDEYITRLNNRFDISNDNASGYWEYPFRIYAYYPVEYDAIVKSFTIGKGASYCIDKQLILQKDVTITVEDGGVLVVDQQLLNNGNIVVNKGGTLVINEGGYIMAYAKDAQGSITLNGGNMIIMDEAKVICDRGEGTMLVRNGATIFNRGVLMVSDALELRNNSYLKNESMGTVVLGGVMLQDRGNIANLNRDQILANLPVNLNKVVFLCSSKSKFWNYGLLSRPWWYEWHDEGDGFMNQGEIRDNN